MPKTSDLVALLGLVALGAAACQPHSQHPFRHGEPPPSAARPPTSSPAAEPGLDQPVPAGAQPPVGVAPPMPTSSAYAAAAARTEGTSKENTIATCGALKSYEYVANEFECADGTNPFNGNAYAASASRRGNVGANSTGHIIDLYDVPCPEGNQEVYVDMYAGCGPGESPFG